MDDLQTLELPVRRTAAGDVATAIEDRGISILLAADHERLAAAVARRLAAAGHLQGHDAVEVVAAPAARPERLDPAAISNFSAQEAHTWS
jgi:hypothetical protein